MNKAKENYEKKLNHSHLTNRNSKQWWETVKNMLGKGCSDSYPPIEITEENRILTGNKGKGK